MRVTEEQLQALEAVAGLTIAPEFRPGVIRNLETLTAQAGLLFDPPLDPHVEPAPVYNP
jgi:hypothetical protein